MSCHFRAMPTKVAGTSSAVHVAAQSTLSESRQLFHFHRQPYCLGHLTTQPNQNTIPL